MNEHIRKRVVLVFWTVLATASSWNAWAQTSSKPDNNYLLEAVQKWMEKSSAENLRTVDFDHSDIEVRIWAGFGLRGSSGGVLRKKGKTWSVSFLEMDRYWAGGTNELAAQERMLPPCIVDAMRDRCVIETSLGSDGRPDAYSLDCAHVYPSPRHNDQQELEQLWETLVMLGVRRLPPTIERDRIMMDGHSYVIEVRVGGDYRATVTEHVHESEIDTQIHKIVSAFDSVMGTRLYGGDD